MFNLMPVLAVVAPGAFQGILLTEASASNSIGTFLSMASEVLTWMLTGMGSVLTFMFSNTVILFGLAMFACVAVIGAICKLL